jgi:hypothetical protein
MIKNAEIWDKGIRVYPIFPIFRENALVLLGEQAWGAQERDGRMEANLLHDMARGVDVGVALVDVAQQDFVAVIDVITHFSSPQ